MMKFEVGKYYEPYQIEYGAIKVIRRTGMTIWVEKNHVSWSMRVKMDADGNEFVTDTITYMAEYITE